jgi:sensor histidine kinase regulating citrate/malate metabolism
VQLSAERVRDGLLLQIEDRGFGMNEDAMADANRKIQENRVDLLDAKQIGLFVVNRLARRQDLDVELRRAEHGGVTAIVRVPEAMLREDPAGQNRSWPRPPP